MQTFRKRRAGLSATAGLSCCFSADLHTHIHIYVQSRQTPYSHEHIGTSNNITPTLYSCITMTAPTNMLKCTIIYNYETTNSKILTRKIGKGCHTIRRDSVILNSLTKATSLWKCSAITDLCGYLPSHTASLPFGLCKIIMLVTEEAYIKITRLKNIFFKSTAIIINTCEKAMLCTSCHHDASDLDQICMNSIKTTTASQNIELFQKIKGGRNTTSMLNI